MTETVNPEASGVSSEKRNPGFVKLRRGLEEHLGLMSGNEVKFYLWLLLSADWKGPNRGCVVRPFADIARAVMFSSKTLQRVCEELECGRKPLIEIQRATNQYAMTRIKILRYDGAGESFGVDKFDHSKLSAVDSAMDSGVDKFDCSTVHSNASKSLESQELQASKNLKNIRKEEVDAVRRRFDAELHPSPLPLLRAKSKTFLEETPATDKTGKAKLGGRIQRIIGRNKESYARWIDDEVHNGRPHPFDKAEKQAFSEIRYNIDLRRPEVSWDFVSTVRCVCEDNRGRGISPGNLCSKVIDALDKERLRDLREGGDGGGYFWPPDFQRHRDALREQERRADALSVPAKSLSNNRQSASGGATCPR